MIEDRNNNKIDQIYQRDVMINSLHSRVSVLNEILWEAVWWDR